MNFLNKSIIVLFLCVIFSFSVSAQQSDVSDRLLQLFKGTEIYFSPMHYAFVNHINFGSEVIDKIDGGGGKLNFGYNFNNRKYTIGAELYSSEIKLKNESQANLDRIFYNLTDYSQLKAEIGSSHRSTGWGLYVRRNFESKSNIFSVGCNLGLSFNAFGSLVYIQHNDSLSMQTNNTIEQVELASHSKLSDAGFYIAPQVKWALKLAEMSEDIDVCIATTLGYCYKYQDIPMILSRFSKTVDMEYRYKQELKMYSFDASIGIQFIFK